MKGRISLAIVAVCTAAAGARAQTQVITEVVSGQWKTQQISYNTAMQSARSKGASVSVAAIPVPYGSGTASYNDIPNFPGSDGVSAGVSGSYVGRFSYQPVLLYEGKSPVGHGKSGGGGQEVEIEGTVKLSTPGLWGGNASGKAEGAVTIKDTLGQNIEVAMNVQGATKGSSGGNINVKGGSINPPATTGWGTRTEHAHEPIPAEEDDIDSYKIDIRGKCTIEANAGRGWWAWAGGETEVDMKSKLIIVYVLSERIPG